MWNGLQALSDQNAQSTPVTVDPIMDSIDSTLSALSDCEMQLAWQVLLQEQQRQQILQQHATTIPFFTPNLASFYTCQQQVVPPVSYFPNYGYHCASEPRSMSTFVPKSTGSVIPEPLLTHTVPDRVQSSFSCSNSSPDSVIRSKDLNTSLPISKIPANLTGSEHSGSTSCEESDGSDVLSSYGNSDATNQSQEGSTNEDVPEPGSRKRKQYWRQVWYKERNKEYSRNWRSKKKQEEETLKSEINMLRAYKELMEESVETHIHDPTVPGFPFTYASRSFLRLLNTANTNVIGINLLSLVHESDQSSVTTAFSILKKRGDSTEATFQMRNPSTSTFELYKSTFRLCEKGVMMITLKVSH
jgi:hypothetical protein